MYRSRYFLFASSKQHGRGGISLQGNRPLTADTPLSPEILTAAEANKVTAGLPDSKRRTAAMVGRILVLNPFSSSGSVAFLGAADLATTLDHALDADLS